MTEISKMFENANAYEMICMYDYRMEYGDVCAYAESKIEEPCKVCKKAKQKIKYYPDFTAEKQIELIKWIAKLDGHFEISCTYNEEGYSFVFYFNRKTEKHKNPTFPYSIMNGSDFVELLAKQINELWQSLTDQEKEEIRRILE